MNGFLPRFSREARGIHLSGIEKDAIRETLQHFLRENPAQLSSTLSGECSNPSLSYKTEQSPATTDLETCERQSDVNEGTLCPLPLRYLFAEKKA